jgi:hypothetical protein
MNLRQWIFTIRAPAAISSFDINMARLPKANDHRYDPQWCCVGILRILANMSSSKQY